MVFIEKLTAYSRGFLYKTCTGSHWLGLLSLAPVLLAFLIEPELDAGIVADNS